jgi:uncharacterized membrane protein YbhN (UPF0104 family)
LLRPAGARLTFGELMAIVYTSTAISLAVPVAGSGLATAYSHRRFRAGNADPAGVGMAMLMAGMISSVAFAVVVGGGSAGAVLAARLSQDRWPEPRAGL